MRLGYLALDNTVSGAEQGMRARVRTPPIALRFVHCNFKQLYNMVVLLQKLILSRTTSGMPAAHDHPRMCGSPVAIIV